MTMNARRRAVYEVKHRLRMLVDRPESDAHRARREFAAFAAASAADPRFTPSAEEMRYIAGEATAVTHFDRHYVYHVAWAARVLARTRPEHHTDIASLIDFSAMLSAFTSVSHFDFRPPPIELPNLSVGRADLKSLPFADRSIESLSCMHVVEHIGLGRYGDPLDPTADLAAMRELRRVLAPGGDLLLVVPVGRPRVVFNAHRVYALAMIEDTFAGLDLVESALVPDRVADGHLLANPDPVTVEQQMYGCGCFWFKAPVE